MTRRERLEAKLEKRRDWAAGATAKASDATADIGRQSFCFIGFRRLAAAAF